jgi:DNA polymerase-3 subunit epsilon
LVLDSLINPERRMGATHIHGITEKDVADAPRFEEIAGTLVQALHGCVLATYNVSFDMRFLEYELQRLGLHYAPPHLCLMFMRPMLGLGRRCSLEDACRCHGIDHVQAHAAATDALAAAQLWNVYLQTMSDRRLRTFDDLANLKSYRFVQSFQRLPLSPPAGDGLRPLQRVKSRSVPTGSLPCKQGSELVPRQLGRTPCAVTRRH